MVCKQCGNEFSDGKNFCPKCGTKAQNENMGNVDEEVNGKISSTVNSITSTVKNDNEERVERDEEFRDRNKKISKKKKIIIGGIIVCILIGSSIVGYKKYQYNTGYRLSTAERKTNIQEQLKQGNYDKAKNLATIYWIDVNEIDDIINVYKDSTDSTSLELSSVEKTLEEKKVKEAEEKKAQEAKEAEEKKAKETEEKRLKEIAENKAKEVEQKKTVKTQGTTGVVLIDQNNAKVTCVGVIGSNYNYRIKFTIENNTNYDITILFDHLSINNLGSVDSMQDGRIKKGTKEDYYIKTGVVGILTGNFIAINGKPQGSNVVLDLENFSLNLNRVPKLN